MAGLPMGPGGMPAAAPNGAATGPGGAPGAGGPAAGAPNPAALAAAQAAAKPPPPPKPSITADLSDELPHWLQIVDIAQRALQDALDTGGASDQEDLEAGLRHYVKELKRFIATGAARYRGTAVEASAAPEELDSTVPPRPSQAGSEAEEPGE